MEIVSKSPEETQNFAKAVLEKLSVEKGNEAMVVGLTGDLGSGKTTFTQFAAKELGVEESVTSPTFVILKKYKIKKDLPFSTLVHIDAYRLEGGDGLGPLDFEAELADPGNLIFIEWPENAEDGLPKSRHTISFEVVDENTRKIRYKNSNN